MNAMKKEGIVVLGDGKHSQYHTEYEICIEITDHVHPMRIRGTLYESNIKINKTNKNQDAFHDSNGRRYVLGIHGFQDNANSFAFLAPELCKHVPGLYFVAIDLPGCGFSDHKKSTTYPLIETVFDVYLVLQSLKWRKCGIVGHSLGANIGLSLVSTFPEMFEYLIALDSFGFMTRDPNANETSNILREQILKRISALKRTKKVYASKTEMVDKLLKNYSKGTKRSSAEMLVERGCRYLKDSNGFIFSYDPHWQLPSLTFLTENQVLNILECIRDVPVLIMYSVNNGNAHIKYGIKSRFEKLQSKKELTFAGVELPGHHFHMDRASETATYIMENFLSNVITLQDQKKCKL